MLQSAFSQIILKCAKQYIKGIEADLKLSLWGGDVVLNNLDLRLDVLSKTLKLDYPYHVSRGFIERLQIHIPWTALTTKPVEITLDSLQCTISCSSDTKSCDLEAESFHSEISQELSAKLEPELPEEIQGADVNESEESGETWAQSLLVKILANLTVRINNLA
eukprot:848157_1